MTLKFKSIATSVALSLTALVMNNAVAAPSESLKQKMANMGTVKDVQPISGGLTAWTLITKTGKSAVFYTTQDEKVMINGTLWDVNTKKNISDALAIKSLDYASPEFKARVLQSKLPKPISPQPQFQSTSDGIGEILGKYEGPLPATISALDKLKGFKEGNGKPIDTVYIFFDPRCKWCHEAYRNTRPYISKGFTIKWIPTVALGKNDYGYSLASALLQNPNSETLTKIFERNENYRVTPSKNDVDQLSENLQFLVRSTLKSTGSDKVSVPTAFYFNKITQKAKMTTGVSESVILEMIFGR